MPTSNGSVLLKDAYAPDDAFITDQLRDAGALILGKASMGEFAGGPWSTLDGQMLNPYNLKRNTGGSSAGSASGVAANLAMLAVGTDTSTSVRGPAAYNGIVALRPTTGLISRGGIAPKNLTFDTAGPMARTVTDVALMMGDLTGVDPDDPKNVETYEEYPFAPDEVATNGIDYTGYLDDTALEGTTLGVMRDFFEGADPEIIALAEEALEVLEEQGATLVDVAIDLEFLEYDLGEDGGSYRDIADYRFYEDFQGYLETLGPDEDVPDTIEEMIELYESEVADSDKPVADSVLNLLKDSLENSTDDPDYHELLESELPEAAAYKLSLFEDNDLDAMVFPYEGSFASPVPNPVESIDDPTFVPDSTPQAAIFAGYSDPGFLGIVVPMGFGSEGLPMDLSFMGRPYAEGELIGYAYDYEQASMKRAPSPLTPHVAHCTICNHGRGGLSMPSRVARIDRGVVRPGSARSWYQVREQAVEHLLLVDGDTTAVHRPGEAGAPTLPVAPDPAGLVRRERRDRTRHPSATAPPRTARRPWSRRYCDRGHRDRSRVNRGARRGGRRRLPTGRRRVVPAGCRRGRWPSPAPPRRRCGAEDTRRGPGSATPRARPRRRRGCGGGHRCCRPGW